MPGTAASHRPFPTARRQPHSLGSKNRSASGAGGYRRGKQPHPETTRPVPGRCLGSQRPPPDALRPSSIYNISRSWGNEGDTHLTINGEVWYAGRKSHHHAFLGRLDTLMRAHDLAFEAQATADLKELIGRILAPYADGTTITIEPGPWISLARRQVTPVCLILHELATNAVKHGALSAPAGQVRVGWQDSHDRGEVVAVLPCVGRSKVARNSATLGPRFRHSADRVRRHAGAAWPSGTDLRPRRFAGGDRVPDRVGPCS